MSIPKLYYFDNAGMGEPIRLAFTIGGIEFEDLRHSMAEWPAVKELSPTGSVPMLEINGVKYVESGAILGYACTAGGLWPKEPLEVLSMLQICHYKSDLETKLRIAHLSSETERPERIAKFMKELPDSLDILERMASTRKPNAPIDMADITLFTFLSIFDEKRYGLDLGDISGKWPNLRNSVNKVAANDKVKAYYALKK